MSDHFKHKEINKITWIQHIRQLKSMKLLCLNITNTSPKVDFRAFRGPNCVLDHDLLKNNIIFCYMNTKLRFNSDSERNREIIKNKIYKF